jgi:hypothetical protein
MDWTPVVAGAAAGLGTGVVGSLVAPWVQHAAESRRSREQHRAALIADWRDLIGRYLAGGPVNGPPQIAKQSRWLSLRSHLSDETRGLAESPPGSTHGIAAADTLRHVSDEVDALERKWKLV